MTAYKSTRRGATTVYHVHTRRGGLVTLRSDDGRGWITISEERLAAFYTPVTAVVHCTDPRHATPCTGPLCQACREECDPQYFTAAATS